MIAAAAAHLTCYPGWIVAVRQQATKLRPSNGAAPVCGTATRASIDTIAGRQD
jgi:hypothetical protein